MIDLFLERGVRIDVQDRNGTTPLIFAISQRRFDTADRLIEKGADPSIANGSGVTPLHYAAVRGARDIARKLIARGADVNAVTDGKETPLHFAAVWADDIEIVNLLLENGAETEIKDDYGRTPFCLTARETGNADIGKRLLHHGADPNTVDRFGSTPLNLAAWRGFGRFVNLLLDSGATVPLRGQEAEEITLFAANRGLDRLFTVLADGGADLTIRNGFDGSLLHSAAAGGSMEIVRSLAGRGLTIGEKDRYGWTPLHSAAEKGRTEVIRWLLAEEVDIDAKSLSGLTALHLADQNEREDAARMLRAKGADDSPRRFPDLRGPYLGRPLPGKDPLLFALDIVSTNRSEHGSIAFSPDGREAYWSSSYESDSGYSYSRILTSRIEGGRWTAPDFAPFSAIPRMGDDVPFFHPDGTRLFFDSGRPNEPGGERGAERIWVMEKEGDGWSEPRRIEGGPNDRNIHWQFSVAANGDIYFGSGGDLWISRPLGGLRYAEAEKLPGAINHEEYREDSPFIAPDESYLLFSGSRRPDTIGQVDLYISFRDREGLWTEPVNVGEPINSAAHDMCPIISSDGKFLFFHSGRSGSTDIYWVDSGFIEKLRPGRM